MPEILAAVARDPHAPVDIATLHLDDPAPNEVLVEIHSSGICHSDLSGLYQHYPFALPGVLGHEGAGIVTAVGSAVNSVAVGDRVVMSQAFCGECETCQSGLVTSCPDTSMLALMGVRTDGTATLSDATGAPVSGGYLGQSSWASHALAREPNVVRIPDDLPWEIAAPFACGVQTGAGAVLNLVKPTPSDSLIVLGAGTVGLSAVMAAAYAGCGTIVVGDLQPARLEIARELGATHSVDPRADDVIAQVQDITGGGADFAVEASGALSAGPLAAKCLNRNGTLVLLGVPPYGTEIGLDWVSIVSGLTVLGRPFGGGSPSSTIEALLKMRAAGALPVEKLVRTYPFADIARAIADMESGSTIKPVLLFD